MKIHSIVLITVAASLFAGEIASAAPVKNSIFRKFKGVYEGRLTGVYGESSGGLLNLGPVAFNRRVRVRNKRRVNFTSPTNQQHRLIWSRPTGSRNRIRMVGRYVGTSFNPHKDVNEPVSGVRQQVIVDRGRGKPKGRRFVMRMNRDLLREGSLSYTRVSGKLRGD
jgi:hypothetical protein